MLADSTLNEPPRGGTKQGKHTVTNQHSRFLTKQCRHPDCKKRVRACYQDRLCDQHRHTPNLCRCQACHKRDEAARHMIAVAARQDKRPGTYKFQPTTSTYGEGESVNARPVTLPATPDWLST